VERNPLTPALSQREREVLGEAISVFSHIECPTAVLSHKERKTLEPLFTAISP
jgi:hypothetical protein